MDRGQYHQWVKLLDHDLGTAVCQAVHRSQHHAEAVEQGDADTEFVVLREAHVLASKVTVVGYAEMRQHDTLWETRRTAGVLHVAHIVTAYVLLHGVKRLVFDVLS